MSFWYPDSFTPLKIEKVTNAFIFMALQLQSCIFNSLTFAALHLKRVCAKTSQLVSRTHFQRHYLCVLAFADEPCWITDKIKPSATWIKAIDLWVISYSEAAESKTTQKQRLPQLSHWVCLFMSELEVSRPLLTTALFL